MSRNSLLLGILLTAFSLALHFLPIWETMLNRGPETWDGTPLAHDYVEEVINAHRSGDDFSFRRRPLTTWCVDAISIARIPAKTAFIALSLLLFLASGLLVYRLAIEFGSTAKQALLAQAFFHVSPTVLFAWFDPMYTYDEPIQYAALLGAVLSMVHGRTVLSIAALTIALIAHETSLFIMPLFMVMLRRSPRRMSITIASPVVLFALFLFAYLPSQDLMRPTFDDSLHRFGTWAFNFSSPAMAAETMGYMAMTLLLPVYLLVRFRGSNAAEPRARETMQAFWISLVLNTLVVLIAAKAREARVLALPLIIVWPLLGKAFSSEWARLGGWTGLLSFIRRPASALVFVLVIAIVFSTIRRGFILSTGIPQDNPWHEYLQLEALLVIAFLFAEQSRQRSRLHPA
ncbi:MAG: hypothetical protein IPM46_13130 [Flavobacteriales bacterium]|nr:hypothetical protein [Flavobacteriales bacterium]